MTNPTPQAFIEAANALQDVAAMDKKSDTELLAEAVYILTSLKLLHEFGMDLPLGFYKWTNDFLAKIER